MNVLNSIFNRVSDSVETLKKMKRENIITTDSVEIEVFLPGSVLKDRAADTKLKFKTQL